MVGLASALGSAEFVHARKYVLALMCVVVLGALNADNVALNIAPVHDMDYPVYGTTTFDFETDLFTLLSYAIIFSVVLYFCFVPYFPFFLRVI